MDDPRLLPPPNDFLGQVRAFARDLAYGFSCGDFTAHYRVIRAGTAATENWLDLFSAHDQVKKFDKYLVDKWGNDPPKANALWALGFFAVIDLPNEDTPEFYMLTEKAFALLEEPAVPPTVFISYKRSESAALGLLTVARMKMAGVPNPFIDMELQPGDLWHAQLEQYVKESQYFVLLLTRSTLKSDYVKKEIGWAIKAQKNIIPIWHQGFTAKHLPSEIPELGNYNPIEINRESAAEYDLAMTLLLNRLGYAP